MTNTTSLTFSWQIEYVDGEGRNWQPEPGPDAQGIVEADPSIEGRENIFAVGCALVDLYAEAHRAEHPGRRWQAKVTSSTGETLGVEAND